MSYSALFSRYEKMFPEIPKRRPRVGAVIKEIRVNQGIRQIDFAKETGINWSTLKSIENDHQKATTVETLDQCAKRLKVPLDEIIRLGREKDPANCFVIRHKQVSRIPGLRTRKKTPLPWHYAKTFIYQDVEIAPISPPLQTPKDFFFCRIRMRPGTGFTHLTLPYDQTVTLFINQGFNLEISCKTSHYSNKGHTQTINTNQGLAFNGRLIHSIQNKDSKEEAVFYLVTRLNPSAVIFKPIDDAQPLSIDIAKGIEMLRKHCSPSPSRLLSLRQLAELTETMTHEQISKLMRVKKGSSVIYWEKIEELLAGAHVSMDDFLNWCQKKPESLFSLLSARNRTMIDQNTYHGVKIYSTTPPQTDNEFFCGELLLEGQKSMGAKAWERKDSAMIGVFVEEGDLEIAVGKSRSALTLTKGESVYFDASLGYVIRNPRPIQAKAFMASYPGIQI